MNVFSLRSPHWAYSLPIAKILNALTGLLKFTWVYAFIMQQVKSIQKSKQRWLPNKLHRGNHSARARTRAAHGTGAFACRRQEQWSFSAGVGCEGGSSAPFMLCCHSLWSETVRYRSIRPGEECLAECNMSFAVFQRCCQAAGWGLPMVVSLDIRQFSWFHYRWKYAFVTIWNSQSWHLELNFILLLLAARLYWLYISVLLWALTAQPTSALHKASKHPCPEKLGIYIDGISCGLKGLVLRKKVEWRQLF